MGTPRTRPVEGGTGRAKALRRQLAVNVPGVNANTTMLSLIHLVMQAQGEAAEKLYWLGELSCLVEEREGWRAVPGCTSFDAFLRQQKLFGRTTGYKLMGIVRRFPRATAFKDGIEKAWAMVRYATLIDELLAIGIDAKLLLGDLEVEALNATQVTAINRRLAASLGHPSRPKPPVAPHTPKTAYARNLQKRLRTAGAKHAIVGSFEREGVKWLRVKMPESEGRYIDPGG